MVSTPPQDMPPITIEAQTLDAIAGHNAVVQEIKKRWPNLQTEILSEGVVNGKFVAIVKANSQPDNKSDNEKSEGSDNNVNNQEDGSEQIKTPSTLIVLIGDEKGFGSDVIEKPASPGKPNIIVTRGDAEDHRLLDERWPRAIKGESSLWDQRLSWKYRTNTVVLINKVEHTAIIEQGDIAAVCEMPDKNQDDGLEHEETIRDIVSSCL